jgi:hypothetical protein
VVILFDGMGGAWRPAVLVGRISDEDRAAFIMTLKMDIVSGCWNGEARETETRTLGCFALNGVYQQKLRYNNRGLCR